MSGSRTDDVYDNNQSELFTSYAACFTYGSTEMLPLQASDDLLSVESMCEILGENNGSHYQADKVISNAAAHLASRNVRPGAPSPCTCARMKGEEGRLHV